MFCASTGCILFFVPREGGMEGGPSMCNSYSFSQYVCGRMCAHLLCAFSVDTSIIKLRVTHMTSARATGRRTRDSTVRYGRRYRTGRTRPQTDPSRDRRTGVRGGGGRSDARHSNQYRITISNEPNNRRGPPHDGHATPRRPQRAIQRGAIFIQRATQKGSVRSCDPETRRK